MWNEADHSQKCSFLYKYVVQVWFEPARVQVIVSQRLNHSATRDADMRSNNNIYFSPSCGGGEGGGDGEGMVGSLDPAVLRNSVDIGFKPIIGDWLRFDTEDMEKKPQSFISSLLRDLFTIS